MDIYNPPQYVPYIITTTGEIIQCTIYDIGDWNMDVNGAAAIAHGLGSRWKEIFAVSGYVRDDADFTYFPFGGFYNAADPSLTGVGIEYWDNTNIWLSRRTGGQFDNASFDSTSYNRGKLFVWTIK